MMLVVRQPGTLVAKIRRVQRAKLLIDETNEPLAQIAYRAGFSSVHRFNATFRELYGRSPSSIRHLRKVFT
jgi:AraC family transcriptional regulator, regulatory protein of adaptative response / methylated-DNA-[protein]-cysteine methyltransferase